MQNKNCFFNVTGGFMRYCALKGFSLLEMTIVLIVIGFLFSKLLMPMSKQMEDKRRKETQVQLEMIKDAVLGFLLVNGRLPCPATLETSSIEYANDTANPTRCIKHYGYLPAQTLGLYGTNRDGVLVDGWGNPFRYAITNGCYCYDGSFCDGSNNTKEWDFIANNQYGSKKGLGDTNCTLNKLLPDSTNSSYSVSDLSKSYLIICNNVETCTTKSNILAYTPVIIFSLGKNGTAVTSNKEKNNLNLESSSPDINKYFVYADYNDSDSTNYYDDLMIWIPTSILASRLIESYDNY